MKFAIVRYNPVTGHMRFHSKHFRWCMYLTSALLFNDSNTALEYLEYFVRHDVGFCYGISKVVE